MNFYPVNLNITDKKCVLIGGGSVALRKLRALLECQPEIVIISPDVNREIAGLITKHNLYHEKREYHKGDLNGVFLCIAATNDRTVQAAVALEAEEQKVLLNSVTDPEVCDFQVPSKIRRGQLLMTVSTCGRSPALSKVLRKQLEIEYGTEYETLVKLYSQIREQLLNSSWRPENLQPVFQRIDSDNCLRHIIADNWQALERDLQSQLPDQCDVKVIIDAVRKQMIN